MSYLSARTFILGCALLLFSVLCALPTVFMLAASFSANDTAPTFEKYRLLLAEERQRLLLLTSLMLGVGSTVGALAVGVPLGLLLARAAVPAKGFLRTALAVPLVLPPYILALAWIYLARPAGILEHLLGRDLLASWTYSLPAAMVVHGLGFYPLTMLAVEAAAQRVDGHLEEAAMLCSRSGRVLRAITLPLMMPSIAAAALVTFVLSLSDFGVPGLLRVRVFTTEVFTAFASRYDFAAATALSLPLMVLAFAAGIGAVLATGGRLLVTRRSLHPGLSWRLGRWRLAVLVLICMWTFAAVVLPVWALARETGSTAAFIAALKSSGEAIANSLLLSATGATLVVTLGMLLGYLRARSQRAWKTFLDPVFVFLFAVPSTVVGIGLIGLWNRPGVAGEIYTSPLIIVVGYAARFTPVAALALAAGVRQVSASLEEAAEVAGASWSRTFTGIVLPQIRSGLIAAWLVAFIFSFGELGTTLLVTPPGGSTLPVHIYTMIANAPTSQVASLALVQAAVGIAPLVLLAALALYHALYAYCQEMVRPGKPNGKFKA